MSNPIAFLKYKKTPNPDSFFHPILFQTYKNEQPTDLDQRI